VAGETARSGLAVSAGKVAGEPAVAGAEPGAVGAEQGATILVGPVHAQDRAGASAGFLGAVRAWGAEVAAVVEVVERRAEKPVVDRAVDRPG
jgi:hypothetical protein